MIPIDPAQVQTALSGYQVGGELGRGAFGLVLAGRHLRLGRPVAIKVLDPGGDGDGLARFAAEAQVLAALDHPHLVRVHDYVEADGLCLIVMEQLPGGTLRAWSGPSGPPSSAAVCAVGLAVAQALGYAHRAGVLHRDVKPGNVLFSADGTPKVTDFGIAKMFDGSAASASAVMGTPKYMAPEQWEEGRLGPATDLYALGVMLYELLAGRGPFGPNLSAAAMMRHHLTVAPPIPHVVQVPPPVAMVVLRALAKNATDRHGSAHAFGLDLARAAAETFGRDWLVRCGIPVRLDDETRDAARPHSAGALAGPSRPESRHLAPPTSVAPETFGPVTPTAHTKQASGQTKKTLPRSPASHDVTAQRSPWIAKTIRSIARRAEGRPLWRTEIGMLLTAVVAVVAVAGAVTATVLATRGQELPAVTVTPPSPDEDARPAPTDPPTTPVWGFARFDDVALAVGQTNDVEGAVQAGSWQSVPATAGHTVSVSHVDPGRYRVVFPDIAVPGGLGAAVATAVATPEMPSVPNCHVVDWGQDRSDQQVDVACQTVDRVVVDAAFTVMFTFAPADYRPDGGEPYAYFRNDAPGAETTERVRPEVSYSLSGPDTIEIWHDQTGHYSIDLIGALYARTGNNLQVNAVGDTDAGCNALGREVKADRQTIFVGCAVGEEWTDTPFVVVYGNQHGLLPEEFRSFGHAFTGVTKDGSPTMPPPLGQTVDTWERYSANSAGATNTVRRVEVGRYEVTFPRVGRAPDHVQLTPYGERTARCALDGWTSPPSSAPAGDVTVTFRCVDAFGEPVDSFASVAYVSALSAATPTSTPAPTSTIDIDGFATPTSTLSR